MAKSPYYPAVCFILACFLSSCGVQIQMSCVAPSRVGLKKGDSLEILAKSHLGNKVRKQLTQELQQGGFYILKENADYRLRLDRVREYTWSNRASAKDEDDTFEETELSTWVYLTKSSGGAYGYAYKYTITTDGTYGDIKGLCQDIARDLQPHRLIFTEKVYPPDNNPHFKEATAYCQAGIWQHAAKAAAQAVQLTPHDAETHYLRGLIERQLENYDVADTCFRKAYQLIPDTRYTEATETNKLMKMGAGYAAQQLNTTLPSNSIPLPTYNKAKNTPWTQIFFQMNI